MQAFEKNNTWDFVDLLEKKKILHEKMVYKLKYNLNVKINWYKAC